MHRFAVTAAMALLVMLIAAGPASGSRTIRLDRVEDPFLVKVASSPGGTVAVAWQDLEGRLTFAVRRRSGRLEGPWRVRTGEGLVDTLAVSDSGAVLLAYRRNDGTTEDTRVDHGCCERLWIVPRPAGRRPSAARRVSPPNVDAGTPRIAFAGKRALVAFSDTGISVAPRRGVWITRTRPGGRPRPARPLNAPGAPSLLDMRLARDGGASLLWALDRHVQRAALPAGSMSPRPRPGLLDPDWGTLDGALGRDGGAALANGSGGLRVMQAGRSGPWGPAATLERDAIGQLEIVALPGGTALVLYDDVDRYPLVRVRGGRTDARRNVPGGEHHQDLLLVPSGRTALVASVTLNAIYVGRASGTGRLRAPRRLAGGSSDGNVGLVPLPRRRIALAWANERGVFLKIARV